MKKFFYLAAAMVILLTLAGCNRNEGSSDSTPDAPASIESNDESNGEDNLDGEITDDEGGNEEGADNSGIEYPNNKAGRIVKAVLESDVWSYMEIADEEITGILIPNLSLDDCAEYCIAYCGMNSQLQYAIAVKPDDGAEEAVENALTEFYNNIKNNPDAAFYPAQETAAAGAVMDTTDDGYVVVIVHENGQTIGDVAYDVE